MPDVTIYHNPDCGTCRETLSLLRQAGVEPQIVEYMTQPMSKETLTRLIDALRMPPRELLRDKDPLYQALNLADARWSDDELIDFMLDSPSLINRPIVETPAGAALCRPPATVHQLLR